MKVDPYFLNDDSLTLTERCKILLIFCDSNPEDIETLISNYNLEELHLSFLKGILLFKPLIGETTYNKVNEVYLKKKQSKKDESNYSI